METINKTDYTDSAERIYLIIRNYVNIPVYETISSVSNYETVMQRSVIKSQIKFQRTSNSIIHTHIYIIYFEFSQEPSFIVHPNRRCLSLLDPTFQPHWRQCRQWSFVSGAFSLPRRRRRRRSLDPFRLIGRSTNGVPTICTIGDTTLRILAFGVQAEGALFAVVMNLAPSTGGRQCRGNSRRERIYLELIASVLRNCFRGFISSLIGINLSLTTSTCYSNVGS